MVSDLLIQMIFLGLPFSILTIQAGIIAFAAILSWRRSGEIALFHLAAIFFVGALLFLTLFLGIFFEEVSQQLILFSIGNLCLWLAFLEICMFYLSVFINRSGTLARYTPAIVGTAAGAALLVVLERDYSTTGAAMLLYGAAMVTVLVLQLITAHRVRITVELFSKEEEMSFLRTVWEIFGAGLAVTSFALTSSLIWLYFKGVEEFSLEVSNFEVVDWLVYGNIPMLLVVMTFILVRIWQVKRNIDEIDLGTIMNVIDAPGLRDSDTH
ncbi:MAG: hypothetical protein ACE5OZ_15390 [Candidatus Heimdallarchaeota archaeon]